MIMLIRSINSSLLIISVFDQWVGFLVLLAAFVRYHLCNF